MTLEFNNDTLISQHWFRKWLGAAGQHAIIWTNVEPDLSRHMALLDLNQLLKDMGKSLTWAQKKKKKKKKKTQSMKHSYISLDVLLEF